MLIDKSLLLAEGLERWTAAASTAGAMLPSYVRDYIQRLDWDAERRERVDMYDILEAVAEACRECQEKHIDDCDGTYSPCPRGLSVEVSPNGGIALVWRSNSHVIALRFLAEIRDRVTMVGGFASHGSGLRRDLVILSCTTDHEDSDRLRACFGLAASVGGESFESERRRTMKQLCNISTEGHQVDTTLGRGKGHCPACRAWVTLSVACSDQNRSPVYECQRCGGFVTPHQIERIEEEMT